MLLRTYCCLALLSLSLSGCLSPIGMDKLSLAYNEATADDISKQLLLNIARAHYNEPIHFSGISNIAATLNFQTSIGATPVMAGGNGALVMPFYSASAAENPTISIVPMQGEEFTKRMLTPITEDKLALLLRQNVDVDLLLRFAVLEFRTKENGREEVYHNRPRNLNDYTLFRQMVMHLSSIQDQDNLYFEPLTFEQHWSIPVANMTPKGFQDIEKEYAIQLDAKQGVYQLSKKITGRLVISNYDPALLPEAERLKLHAETEANAPNDLLVDIRPEFPGGAFPIHGKLRLRSFSNILYFIGRSLAAEPEKMVEKDPRTPEISENPQYALEISETDNKPDDTNLTVYYKSKYYSVKSGEQHPWNMGAFKVLSQIFQMTMAELPKGLGPSITISK